MRKSKFLRILYIACTLCVINAILSPACRTSFSGLAEFKSQSDSSASYMLDLLSLAGEFPDDERDQLSDDDDYLPFAVVMPEHFNFVHRSFNKIPSQESLLEYPSFGKFKPPPQV